MTVDFTKSGDFKLPMRVDRTLTEREVYKACVEYIRNHGIVPADRRDFRIEWDVTWTETRGEVTEKIFKVDIMILEPDEVEG